MSFAVTYIFIKLKELFRSKIYLGFGAFMLLLAFCMAALLPRVDSGSNYTIAVLNEYQTQVGAAVLSTLEGDGGYTLRVCADRRELEGAVLSGEALCGYSFDKDADERIQKGVYAGLADSFYREKSPAAALCDEAVCGAVFGYISPSIAARTLRQNGFDTTELQSVTDSDMMNIVLLGADGQAMKPDSGSIVVDFLYGIFCSLTAVFAIITAFYTQSINKSLVLAGQSPLLVGLCGFISYSVSYIAILTAAHMAVGCFMPALLADSSLLWRLGLTALAGGGLQMLSRRFLSPAVIPLLPFAAVLMVAATVL